MSDSDDALCAVCLERECGLVPAYQCGAHLFCPQCTARCDACPECRKPRATAPTRFSARHLWALRKLAATRRAELEGKKR